MKYVFKNIKKTILFALAGGIFGLLLSFVYINLGST